MFFCNIKHHTKHLQTLDTRARGFTLVEALVAIFILTISITALMGVVSQSIFTSGYTKNKTVAIALAQEGVEMVRNIQDNTLLNNSLTLETLAQSFLECSNYGTGVCIIEPLTLEIQSCEEDGYCPPLRISEAGYFNYAFGTESPFTRSISVLAPTGNSRRAVVKVEWMQGQTLRSVEYEAELFLWIQ